MRLSKLLRSYAADLLNAGIGEKHSVEVEISSEAETAVIECDARLISRALAAVSLATRPAYPIIIESGVRISWETPLIQLARAWFCLLNTWDAFSKGYLQDYPVFVRDMDNGLLVLGYPKDSFMKLTGNYFPIREFVRHTP